MGSIVGGFYLGLEDLCTHNKPNGTQPGFWLDLLARTIQLESSCILLIGNNQVTASHYPSPYKIDCASQWQLATANLSSPITLQSSVSLARHIALHGYQNGVNWTLETNHNYDAPFHLLHACLLQPLNATMGKPLPCIPISLHSPIGVSLNFADCLNLSRSIRRYAISTAMNVSQ